MKTNRPKIELSAQPLDIIIDLISITIFMLIIVYTATNYSELGETIPTHFNGKGEVDGFGDKNMVWMLPGIGIVIFIVLFILIKYPHLHNYMVNITKENALKNYRFSTRILRFTTLSVALVFAFIQYMMIEKGKGNEISPGSWFTPTIIGVSLILSIFLTLYKQKINN